MYSKIPLTLIIADCTSQASLTDCLKNLNSWSLRKIIVSNNSKLKEILMEDSSVEVVCCDSKSIYQLWKRGLRESETRWNILITSDEIVTGQLKISIENRVQDNLESEALFKLKKKVIFLKRF